MEKLTTGEIIAKLRKEKGISQEELADALYVTRQAVGKWEANLGSPDITNLKNIANYFGVSVDYLLTGENEKEIKSSPNTTEFKTGKNTHQIAMQNKKKMNMVISIFSLLGVILFFVGLFLPLYDAEVITISFFDLFNMEGTTVGMLLFALGLILSVLWTIIYTAKKNLKHLNVGFAFVIICSIVGLIVCLCGLMFMVEGATPNGAGFYLIVFGLILLVASFLIQAVFKWLVKTNRVSEEKLYFANPE